MLHHTTYIDPKAFIEAMSCKEEFKYIDGKHLYIPPYDVKQPEGYEAKPDFPNCCQTHKYAHEQVNEYFTRFPNCCATHKKLSEMPGFDVQHYSDFPERFLKAVTYTEHVISEKIQNEDWFVDIVDFIEYCWESLGHPPTLTGYYFRLIRNYINNPPEGLAIPDLKKAALTAYLDKKLVPKAKDELPDVNKLYNIYHKWLKIFPFHLSFFEGLKQRFDRSLPILANKPTVNKYTHVASAQIAKPEQLLEYLYNLTIHILKQVDTVELYKDGKISDYAKQEMDLINSSHAIRQKALLGEFSKGEMKYIKALKMWLLHEKQYFKEVSKIVTKAAPPTEPTKAEILNGKLYQYGFGNLPKVQALSASQRENLINKIASEKLPYQIAMLDFLGFFTFAQENHFDSKFKMFKVFDHILNGNERDIKGNLSVLSLQSKERERKRYTAHLHKEVVEKDYKNIK